MEYLDLTLPAPSENLACDEALLDLCDSGAIGETLRFWESSTHFVVVGYGNHVDREVNIAACERAHIPILRRCTGGGAVLQGPGCLNYAIVLRIDQHFELESISSTNCHIMLKQRDALRTLGLGAEISGYTDLVLTSPPFKKFSGNSQRRKRAALLFHGTFLYDFDLRLLEETLKFPSLQPDYRQNRSHADFVANLSAGTLALKQAIGRAWNAHAKSNESSKVLAAAKELAQMKYAFSSWNRKI